MTSLYLIVGYLLSVVVSFRLILWSMRQSGFGIDRSDVGLAFFIAIFPFVNLLWGVIWAILGFFLGLDEYRRENNPVRNTVTKFLDRYTEPRP